MALITQSVDSRNHVIVAISVTVGLIASLLRFPLLDTLVGLAVAVLILQSAIELAVETVHSLGVEEVDLSHYKLELAGRYERFQQTQMRDWMLYMVEKQGIETRADLIARARQILDFDRIPTLRAIGMGARAGIEMAQPPSPGDALIEQSLSELFQRGWLAESEPLAQLVLTDAGSKHLRQLVREKKGNILLHKQTQNVG